MEAFTLILEDGAEDSFIEILESMTELHADVCKDCKKIVVRRIP
jgi:hypothetical protein